MNHQNRILTRVLCLSLLSTSLAFAQEGDRKSAERPGRRSAEAEAGRRRSAEGDAPRRRSAEADRGRSTEGRRETDQQPDASLRRFKPQTEREAQLFRMIQQLQREVAALRRQVRGRRGADGDQPHSDSTQADSRTPGRFKLADGWERTKEGKVFRAYDKNGDKAVVLEEWLAMTNGNINDARRRLQTERFRNAEPGGDGRFTPAEFIWWYSVGRHQSARDGEAERTRRDKAREGDAPRHGPRDGDRKKEGRRDGDARRDQTRDGNRDRERSDR